MRDPRNSRPLTTLLAILSVALSAMVGHAVGQKNEEVIHNFRGADGANPYGGVILDAAGNAYGTTVNGGTSATHRYVGWGTAFELQPKAGGGWAFSRLYNFDYTQIYVSPLEPFSSLTLDASGNLYGTSYGGVLLYGTAFELSPDGSGGWSETTLYGFADFAEPFSNLISDSSGNFYGTTSGNIHDGFGTVFELSRAGSGAWTAKTIYTFEGPGGLAPIGGLVFDAAGNLYGTTVDGGAYGYGAVFELSPVGDGSWTEKVLYSFNGKNQSHPTSGLILDASGNLYGTVCSADQCLLGFNIGAATGDGAVFELVKQADGTWSEKVLHSFKGIDGSGPGGSLIFDGLGNLYGVTCEGGAYGGGTMFKLRPNGHGGWAETTLHDFGSGADGSAPYSALVVDHAGNLYGTTYYGGTYGKGTVFRIKP